ncbi:tetratricopeptide repeat-containing sensor histidine kinase [Chitinophaga sp. RAB17]|uniref:tetratricopeptide repeat-containing sensor histidine kinase n=1 Tax=Chitinophaga sp. RAB17 TaxID=3233049 RepID=UPI003F9397F7
MNVRTSFAFFCVLTLLVVAACKNNKQQQHHQENTLDTTSGKDYLSLVISLDTLLSAGYKEVIYREDSLLRNATDSTLQAYYHYFSARRYSLEKKRDSAMAEYRKMAGKKSDVEVDMLKTYSILDNMTSNGTVDGVVMSGLLSALKKAESTHSRLTYRFYDLMAKAYYQNHNGKESLEYAERYYKNHPYKSHPVIRQRYYDISFMLASRADDYEKMMLYNVKARNLAKSIGDSLAIARSYDNLCQVYARQGKPEKAVEASRVFVDYLKKSNNLMPYAYNNLATSFIRNNQLDSAIHYYKEAIALARKNKEGREEPSYYKGLIEAYKKKGAYAEAMRAADYAFAVELDNLRRIEAVKVEEIHAKYETEKKDRNIAELSSRNALNEKVIRQQRWTLALASLVFIGILLFFYILHRQYRLKEKNKLLQSENSRLNMEQKLLQAQLNPHFIFNSIANLQSLVASGDTKESVRYLSAFSGLLRSVLEQSRRDFISLEEEVTSLKNYLQLQRMRFAGIFDYQVTVADDLYPENILIPPMLVQPFIENSIEHGFRNIQYKGILTVSFSAENNQVLIVVDDNGTGITSKKEGPQKKRSLAGIILKERLEALFKSSGQEAKFEIENKENNGAHGVTVRIVIPEIKD